MHFKLFCYAARPACMSVCILVSVRMEISSLICKVYMFTKAEETTEKCYAAYLHRKEYIKHAENGVPVACIQCFHLNEAPPIF